MELEKSVKDLNAHFEDFVGNYKTEQKQAEERFERFEAEQRRIFDQLEKLNMKFYGGTCHKCGEKVHKAKRYPHHALKPTEKDDAYRPADDVDEVVHLVEGEKKEEHVSLSLAQPVALVDAVVVRHRCRPTSRRRLPCWRRQHSAERGEERESFAHRSSWLGIRTQSPGATDFPFTGHRLFIARIFACISEGWGGRRFLSPPARSAPTYKSPATFSATGVSPDFRRRTVSDGLFQGQPGGGVGFDGVNSGEPFPPWVGVLLCPFHPALI
ncbi:hypothetical protein Cgig2_016225 [Carnegiea gigantea]|uniref:Uncharacterized protein n=1 Tax=Carnegiea gigantea TaxID=171969 RepID=A0A9Q1JM22_9CARY|nr:hypothetical protein Cgig2_016225 [Carnegiea gigantea]